MCSRSISPGMNPDRSASLGRACRCRRAGWQAAPPHRSGLCGAAAPAWVSVRAGRWVTASTGSPTGLAVGVDGLQVGAEQFAGVGVNVLDLQPLRLVDGLCRLAVLTRSSSLVVVVGVVEGEPAEEQVGEQVGAALLVGAWIVGAEAAGRGGEHAVDGGGVGAETSPVT